MLTDMQQEENMVRYAQVSEYWLLRVGGVLNSKVHQECFNSFCIIYLKNLKQTCPKCNMLNPGGWMVGCSLQNSRSFCECLKYLSNT